MQPRAIHPSTRIALLWVYPWWLWCVAATILLLVSGQIAAPWTLNQTLLRMLRDDPVARISPPLQEYPRINWLEGEKGFMLDDPATHTRALAIWAEQPNWSKRMLYARAYATRNEPATALQWLEVALQLQPDFFEAIEFAGLLANQRTDWPQAVHYWKRAVELAPTNAKAHTNLGMAHYHLGDIEAARYHLRKGVALSPFGWEVNNNYLTFLRDVGPLDEYGAELERVRAFTPEAIVYDRWAGELALQQQDYAKAEKELTYVLEQRPDWTNVAETLAQLYMVTERPQLAADQYRYALSLSPERVRYHMGYLRALHAGGDTAAVQRHLCQVQQTQPDIYQQIRSQLNIAEADCRE